jgi:hypothetical protein
MTGPYDSEDTTPGCFIATACYGTPTEPKINILRAWRDNSLRKTELGRAFIQFYYANSPPVARFLIRHKLARVTVRSLLVEPAVWLCKVSAAVKMLMEAKK